jgi:hypothetical protein
MMKTSLRRCMVIFIAIIFFSSCKKDEEFSVEPSSLYYKSSIQPVGPMKFFTGNGEIQDLSTINKYYGLDSAWFTRRSRALFPEHGAMDTVRFIDQENARMYNYYSYRDCSITKQNSDLLLTDKLTIQLFTSGDVFTNSPMYLISQYKPAVYSEFIVSSTGGNYLFGYDTRYLFVLSPVNGTLKANWIIMTTRSANRNFNVYSIQNKPDFNFYRSMTATDTVLMQQYVINYTKK